MTESNLPALVPYLPPDGSVFFTGSGSPLADVSADLCRIASFLQSKAQFLKLQRFHDWWEHDALHFPSAESDYHGLLKLAGTPRSVFESMTGDHRVFIAFSSPDPKWYLRFFADWDDDGTSIVGEYSVALGEQQAASFAVEVISKLKCSTAREDVLVYFRRIEA